MPMRILVTGASGYVGSALIPRLAADGHVIRGYGRSAARITAAVDEVVEGDAALGTGLDRAVDGVETAYFLILSMEGVGGGAFVEQERRAAENFAAAAAGAGGPRIGYLGGLGPREGRLAPRAAPARPAAPPPPPPRARAGGGGLGAAPPPPESIAMRASIVIGAR